MRSMLLLALLLPACASGPKYAEVEARIPPVPKGKGRVFFYRPDPVFGAALKPKVTLDGEEVGQSKGGCFFFVDCAPGNHVVDCTTEAKHALSFTLAAGEVRYVRMVVSMGLFVGHVEPQLADPGEARAAVAKCRYSGAPLE